jgi:methyl-accepting chemotaxis protein
MKSIFKKLRNLNVKLVICFLVILIIPAVMIGTFSYNAAKGAVQEQVEDSISEHVKTLNKSVDDMMNPKIMDIETFAKTITSDQYEGVNSPVIRKSLDLYIQMHPEVSTIYVGKSDGVFIRQPNVKMQAGYDPRERDWYKDAEANKGKSVISAPYVAAGTGKMVVTISKTLEDGSGVVAVDINLTELQALAQSIEIGEDGYAFILDQNKKFIAHPTEELGSQGKEKFFDKFYEKENGQFQYKFDGKEKFLSYATNELTGWKMGGNIYTSEISKAATPILKTTFLVILLAVIIGIVAVFFIVKSIVKPLKQIKETAVTVSQGDLTQYVDINTDDVIGELGKAFNGMLDGLRGLVQKVEQTAEQVASSAEQLSASAEETNAATEQVSDSIQGVAKNAEKETTAIDITSQSLKEVSVGVVQIADHSAHVAELSRQAVVHADAGGKVVTNTVNQMQSIHGLVTESHTTIQSLYESSNKVSDILEVISGIADQTNLLALNAAIEAARAGEHGKGFAVVADEVRKLAEQTQSSAKEINAIVKSIQSDTENTVQMMNRITEDVKNGVDITNEAIEKFNGILISTREIVPQMEEVSATAEQMSATIQEVESSSEELVKIAQTNAKTSEEVAASAEEQLASMQEISASAQSLSSMAEELKSTTTQFKIK